MCFSVGITLAFVIPRVPGFQFNADKPLVAASSDFNKTVPTYFNRAPTNFSFPGTAQLQLDTGSNYIPIHMRHIDADVYDLSTNKHVGEGHIDSLVLPAKKFIQIDLPLNFSYVATNTSDQTCKYKPSMCDDMPWLTCFMQGITGMMVAGTLPITQTANDLVSVLLSPISLFDH